MWNSSSVVFSAEQINTQFVEMFKSSVQQVISPIDKSQPSGVFSSAESDVMRKASIEYLSVLKREFISPWGSGEFSQNKNSIDALLSPVESQAILADLAVANGWPSLIALLVVAGDVKKLAVELNALYSVFPDVLIAKAIRRSESMVDHEKEKLFIADNSLLKQALISGDSLGGIDINHAAKNSLSISESIMKSEIGGLFSDFKQKRIDRCQSISEAITNVAMKAGAVKYSLKLSGNIKSQLGSIKPPHENAPYSCLLSFGGTEEELRPLAELLSL